MRKSKPIPSVPKLLELIDSRDYKRSHFIYKHSVLLLASAFVDKRRKEYRTGIYEAKKQLWSNATEQDLRSYAKHYSYVMPYKVGLAQARDIRRYFRSK